ncbi:hypothetical protein J2X55_000082 [Microbacterium sp. 1154]|uniref:WxL protein peptidoglycan domain-containing protein n=1 Tax=Microbacterium sp. 1154 TaxID=2817733 RepID=UPI000E240070|nr:DUF916 domain-containing protein [Microbacterium sp. 1154]MDR6689183.1 hypothetical protein [Microbacterium sp. 1154]
MRATVARGGAATLAVLFAAAAALVSAPPAAADDAADSAVTWSVTPASAEGPDGRRVMQIELDPGQRTTEHLAVKNFSEREATFTLSAADGYYTETGRFTMLPADRTSVDAGTWITVEPSVTLAPNETRVIAFEIAVPQNATPGDHAAGVSASVRSTSAGTDGTKVGVDSRVGFRVSTRVTGELAPAVGIGEVRAEYTPSWNLFAPGSIAYSYTAENTGNTALAVTDAIDGTTGERGVLLPGESRRVQTEAQPAWPTFVVSRDVTVDAAVPDSTLAATPVTQSITVWAVPWLHLAAAIGLALIVAAVASGRRRSRRRLDDLVARAREEGRREAVTLS